MFSCKPHFAYHFVIKCGAFDLCPVKQTGGLPVQPTVLSVWSPPPGDWLKCNADGAFYTSGRQGATGVVIRDGNGGFHGAEAKWYTHAMSAIVMEAATCRDG